MNEEEQAKKLGELELKEQEELLHSQLSDTSQVDNVKYSGKKWSNFSVRCTQVPVPSVSSCLFRHPPPRARQYIVAPRVCGAAGAVGSSCVWLLWVGCASPERANSEG